MAFEFHKDKTAYFTFQYENARKHIVPFIDEVMPIAAGCRVLEIGCAEAGVLKAFTERGCRCTGIELNNNRLNDARRFMKNELEAGIVDFINQNIYNIDASKDLPWTYDLIILKDVIEHIPDQERFMKHLRGFLSPGGRVFLGFPPWPMPFGGHQQICQSKFLSRLPYFHLLPTPFYRGVLILFDEPKPIIKELCELKKTGISIERFESICQQLNYVVCRKKFYLINPIYEYKFGIRERELPSWLAAIPYLRDFITTAAYYLIE